MTTYLSTPSFYTILINNVSGFPKAAPNDGFIDSRTVEQYAKMNSLNLETGINSFTLTQSESKAKANARYHMLLLQLNRDCNIKVSESYFSDANGFVSTITYGGSPNYNTEPSSIQFTVMVERGDPSLQTWDELNPGTLLTGTAALTRFVVRALTNAPNQTVDITMDLPVYDPTAGTQSGTSVSVPRYGTRIMPLDVGPVVFGGSTSTNYTNAAALVTISQPFTPPAS